MIPVLVILGLMCFTWIVAVSTGRPAAGTGWQSGLRRREGVTGGVIEVPIIVRCLRSLSTSLNGSGRSNKPHGDLAWGFWLMRRHAHGLNGLGRLGGCLISISILALQLPGLGRLGGCPISIPALQGASGGMGGRGLKKL